FSYSPNEVLELSERIFAYARADFPGIKFYLCAPSGNYKLISPERELRNSKRREYDTLLRDYVSRHNDCTYVSIMGSPQFFNDPSHIGNYDRMREDIFSEDKVHFNTTGYELYAEFFK